MNYIIFILILCMAAIVILTFKAHLFISGVFATICLYRIIFEDFSKISVDKQFLRCYNRHIK